jgi:transcription-repair coupling factor (superfamily II helicase)
VLNLLEVARLRERARRAGLTDITLQGAHVRFAPVELPESREVRVQRLYPKTVLKPAVRTMLVPVPKAVPGRPQGAGRQAPSAGLGAQPLRDQELLTWSRELVEAMFDGVQASAPAGED